MTVITAELQGELVRPRTLIVRAVPYTQSGVNVSFAGVFGGQDGNVWVATFLDPDEAEAWIEGCKRFGEPIKGAVLGTRSNSGNVSQEESGGAGGSVREAHEPGTPVGPRPAGNDPVDDALPLPDRDEVGAGGGPPEGPAETAPVVDKKRF